MSRDPQSRRLLTGTARLRIGGRTEALLLLPAALLLLVLVSLFVLFGYRGTVDQLLDARGLEAAQLARSVAAALPEDRLPSPERLRQLAPQAWAVALLDDAGVPLVTFGDLAPRPAPARPTEHDAAGGGGGGLAWLLPSASAADVVSGSAPLARRGRVARVRVDLPAPVLRGKARALRVLTPLVLAIDVAMTLLLLLYLRRLLASFDRMVATARRAGTGSGTDTESDTDDVALLVATFERAVEALRGAAGEKEPQAVPADDELAAFQHALARSLESGVLLCDHDGRVLSLNDVGAAVLGVEPGPPGTALRRLLAGRPALRRLLEDAVLRQRAVNRSECEIAVGDEVRTLGLTVHPLRRDDGAVRGFLILFADLTAARQEAEQKRLDDNLSQVGALAAGVAHEMRNGLATLRGYLGLIERAREDGAVNDYLREIRRESDHLERVLDDFLQLTRPGSQRAEEVDLLRLLRRCAGDPALEDAPVRVRTEGAAPVTTHADPHLIERALRNLLRNAVQAQRAADRDEPIDATLTTMPAALEVRIEDRGPGLPPEVAENLFQPFVSARPGGVGLGLALSRRIVALHGGELRIVPRAGGGTSARVRLPRAVGGKSATFGNKISQGIDPAAREISGDK